MNTSPNTKRILCFGDSNTWGRSGKNKDRYPPYIRWTGLLQSKLGKDFEIIEEGLRSRTTNLKDPHSPGRNGLSYLVPCLESHYPLDFIILWLGTNDLKSYFERSPDNVGVAMQQLIKITDEYKKETGQNTKIILVSPPLIRENQLRPESVFVEAGVKSKQLGSIYQRIAINRNCLFVDLAQHVKAGEYDGVHLEPKSHAVIAELFFSMIDQG